MVRFSCFNAQIYHHKPKKTGQSFSKSADILQAPSKILANEAPSSTKALPSAVSKEIEDDVNNCRITGSALQRGWNSNEMDGKLSLDWKDDGVHQASWLKKSQSENGLHLKGRISSDEDTGDESPETDQVYSCDHSNDHIRSAIPDGSNEAALSPTNYGMPNPGDTLQESSLMNNGSIFSIGDSHNSNKMTGQGNLDAPSDHVVNSCDRSPQSPHLIIRLRSLPNLGTLLPHSVERISIESKSRSSDDLHVLNRKMDELYIQEVSLRFAQERERHYGTNEIHNDRFDNLVEHGDYDFNYDSSAREWIVPTDGHEKFIEYGSSSVTHHRDNLPGKDFKIKRIEDWVINLQPCSPIEEKDKISQADDKKKEVAAPHSSIVSKVVPGTESAKRYISSLNPGATSAQLSNHGLAVIPFLSAFVSLKILNLSGNAIVRITAGALPRGLHVLNLSKNHISAIEGLRELTRLRVLDLSYNRIFRIGHGLASCCSLKELYLAGNKISEVEGLHRLLKLNILDLRFNKISTGKCLGQLAANYLSLQAISLEGNPAQKNVGDEQLKKYLQGLLPQLTYYNRQFIKVGASKDSADRSVRLGMGTHQSRSDYKSVRKGSHGISSKVASSSGNLRKSHGPGLDRSKGKYVKFPSSTGSKTSTHHHHHHHQAYQQFDLGDRMRSLKQKLSIRRSHSDGNFAAF
ncbi:hypothetical protein SAY86_018524 [Trapa natans]|uniref:Ig-like domain-containing protein n=1 Tax=Trapa natans TaxID=22666 RepID=A0AAN7R1T4_TRANT|nr:hypothetical protein SAY86_018524 [Trapa natans]